MKKIAGKNNGTLTKLEPGDRLPGSGHPGGENFKTVINRFLSARMVKNNPLTGKDDKLTGMELLVCSLLDRALKGDVSAAREILDRIEGKVKQSYDIDTSQWNQKLEVGVVMVDRPLLSDESQLEKR